ncbi:hypothetical protein BCR42DRAFT_415661 [Absidia repens]|uniref:Uncharacterized protein n=1 Tax=Absidia repens TaxID=90262 RepID=A0A1X2IFH5_9FUNG|nr:hypothetical protein BCR42DRAFT_415661 [Absidia repens]
MNALYEDVFDKFTVNIDKAKYGVIYALYFLFITQPTTWPIHSIRVDIDRWTKLFDFYLQCCKSGTKEGAQAAMIFRKMKDGLMAFTFTVNHKFETASILVKKEMEASHNIIDGYQDLESKRSQNDATSTCYDSTTDDITALANRYQKVKQQAIMTPQATLVMQRWLKDTMNINETDRRKLQNVMLKSVLATKETTFIDSVTEAGRQMWVARADHGLSDIDVMLPHRMPPRVYTDKVQSAQSDTTEVELSSRPRRPQPQQQQHRVDGDGGDGGDDDVDDQDIFSSTSDVASPL